MLIKNNEVIIYNLLKAKLLFIFQKNAKVSSLVLYIALNYIKKEKRIVKIDHALYKFYKKIMLEQEFLVLVLGRYDLRPSTLVCLLQKFCYTNLHLHTLLLKF